MLQCYIFERARIQRLTVFQMLHPGENLHRTCMLGMVDVCALFCVVLKMDLKELINAVYYCFFTINSDVNEDVRDVILEVVHMKDCAYLTKSMHSVCTFWGFV